MPSSFFDTERIAEKIRTTPKIIAIYILSRYIATIAPATAPVVVAISRNIPMRTLVIPSFIYAAAAPEDVAIDVTNAAPTAYLISTPNPRVKIGITITPPPKPVSEPINPAKHAPINKTRENISKLKSILFCFDAVKVIFLEKIQGNTASNTIKYNEDVTRLFYIY